MDSLTHIVLHIKKYLDAHAPDIQEKDAVALELVPLVLATLQEDHTATLEHVRSELVESTDEALLAHPQMQNVLEESIKKVCDVFIGEHQNITLTQTAEDIVSKDTETLLRTQKDVWNRLKKKTYQELLNDGAPGNNDERVYLWLEEIKKATGVKPEPKETVGEYSVRAIVSFLRSKK